MNLLSLVGLALLAAAPAGEMPLINPPAWGRVISPQTHGAVEVRRVLPGALVLGVKLAGMAPDHPYILCLNDRPGHPGNEWLPSAVPGHPEEKYLDFTRARTDGNGRFEGEFTVPLHPGLYNIRFYVKDPDDFKIVLYHDYFDVAVK